MQKIIDLPCCGLLHEEQKTCYCLCHINGNVIPPKEYWLKRTSNIAYTNKGDGGE